MPTATAIRPKIALVAGEASGDLLGAGLIRALRERYPHAGFVGVGGDAMVDAGLVAWHPAERLSVMGLIEVLKHLPALLRLRRELVARLIAYRPDVFIGIDAPDFNLGLERRLKQAGIPTVHYVSPSIWAWRESRAAKIGASADRVLCLFPMEPAIYARHGVDARFVGHPLAERFPIRPDRGAARRALDLPEHGRVLALLPGSRRGEIALLGEIFARAAEQVAHAFPGLRLIAPMANAACRDAFLACLDRCHMRGRVEVVDGRAHEVMTAADVVLLASGTATLEALLAKRAMVVGYRLNAFTYFIVRAFKLMKVTNYALPNILAGQTLVPERMQRECTPEALADDVLTYLRDPARGEALIPRFERIHEGLRRNADCEAAAAVAELIEGGAR